MFRLRAALLVSLGVAGLALAGCDDGPKTGSPGLEPPRGVRDGGATDPTGGQGGSGGLTGTGGRTGMSPGTSSGAGGNGTATPGSGGTGAMPGEDIDLDAGSEATTDAPYFLGFWVIDQPSHALYEATLYELAPGGVVNVGPTELLGGEPWPGFVTGTVSDATMNVRCDLRGPWQSPALRELVLGSMCTDGTSRSVTLTFPEHDPAIGIQPTSLRVDGESGWAHAGFPWAWRKCPGSMPCTPF